MNDIIEDLKKKVYLANLRLKDEHLIKLTWGNVSIVDRELEIIVIKPSGIPYNKMLVSDMVVTDLHGQPMLNQKKPSSDLMTHVELYKNFPEINSIVHTHSLFATVWAQAGMDIQTYGTTHADSFYGDIPCTRFLKESEVQGNYEKETGTVIIEKFRKNNISPIATPGVLVNGHGSFTWGKNSIDAVDNSVILEEVAKLALYSKIIDPELLPIPNYLSEKHYERKHGKNAYYGQ